MSAPKAGVVVASTRASRGEYADLTGPIIVDALTARGFSVPAPAVVADGPGVGQAISAYVIGGARLVITTGGTGLTPSDQTPEVTRALLDREVPGIAEAIRAAGVARGVPTAMLSRGVAGTIGDALVINLPGSRGGVGDALEVIAPVLEHALAQLRGGDHR